LNDEGRGLLNDENTTFGEDGDRSLSVYLCVSLYICLYVYMYVCTYVCMCMYMYVCLYVCELCLFVCLVRRCVEMCLRAHIKERWVEMRLHLPCAMSHVSSSCHTHECVM